MNDWETLEEHYSMDWGDGFASVQYESGQYIFDVYSCTDQDVSPEHIGGGSRRTIGEAQEAARVLFEKHGASPGQRVGNLRLVN